MALPKKGTGGRAHIDQSKRAYGVLQVDPSACIFLRTFNAEEIYIQEEDAYLGYILTAGAQEKSVFGARRLDLAAARERHCHEKGARCHPSQGTIGDIQDSFRLSRHPR